MASEKEQLERLTARKAEATRLTYELDDIISSAKLEIDRLIDENKKMKQLIPLNQIFYGPPGIGKYTQVLNYIKNG
mgnify:CR=1 FL=1